MINFYLLELSSTPCWNMTRRILLALFWVLWCGAIVWSVIIVVKAPKCKAEPNEAWFTNGGCARLDTKLESAVDDLKALEAGKYAAIVVSGSFSNSYSTPERHHLAQNLEYLKTF